MFSGTFLPQKPYRKIVLKRTLLTTSEILSLLRKKTGLIVLVWRLQLVESRCGFISKHCLFVLTDQMAYDQSSELTFFSPFLFFGSPTAPARTISAHKLWPLSKSHQSFTRFHSTNLL